MTDFCHREEFDKNYPSNVTKLLTAVFPCYGVFSCIVFILTSDFFFRVLLCGLVKERDFINLLHLLVLLLLLLSNPRDPIPQVQDQALHRQPTQWETICVILFSCLKVVLWFVVRNSTLCQLQLGMLSKRKLHLYHRIKKHCISPRICQHFNWTLLSIIIRILWTLQVRMINSLLVYSLVSLYVC